MCRICTVYTWETIKLVAVSSNSAYQNDAPGWADLSLWESKNIRPIGTKLRMAKSVKSYFKELVLWSLFPRNTFNFRYTYMYIFVQSIENGPLYIYAHIC